MAKGTKTQPTYLEGQWWLVAGRRVSRNNKQYTHLIVFREVYGPGPHACAMCGEDCGFTFDVHHLDEDHSNNNPDNLCSVHADCHIAAHATGRLPNEETVEKLRTSHIGQGKKDACINGHPYPESAYHDRRGHVAYCKVCIRRRELI